MTIEFWALHPELWPAIGLASSPNPWHLVTSEGQNTPKVIFFSQVTHSAPDLAPQPQTGIYPQTQSLSPQARVMACFGSNWQWKPNANHDFRGPNIANVAFSDDLPICPVLGPQTQSTLEIGFWPPNPSHGLFLVSLAVQTQGIRWLQRATKSQNWLFSAKIPILTRAWPLTQIRFQNQGLRPPARVMASFLFISQCQPKANRDFGGPKSQRCLFRSGYPFWQEFGPIPHSDLKSDFWAP